LVAQPFEKQVGIAVVVDHGDVVLLGELDEPAATRLRHHRPRWILVRRDRVDELGLDAFRVELPQFHLEVVRVHAIVVDLHAGHVDLELPKAVQAPDVAILLDNNRVARLEVRLANETDRLHRAVRQGDVLKRQVLAVVFLVALGGDFTQRQMATWVGRPRIQHERLADAGQYARRRLYQLLRGEGVWIRVAGAKGELAHDGLASMTWEESQTPVS